MGVASRTLRNILFVDDDTLFADAAADILRARGYHVKTAGSLRDAASHDPRRFDCVVVDHQLPDGDGLSLANQLLRSRTRVVLVSATPRIDAAAEAQRAGLLEFLPKPIDFDSLVGMLQPGFVARPPAPASTPDDGLLPSMHRHAPLFEALARSRCAILLLGETGSGKGHLARAIHNMAREAGPLVPINCAAIPSTLVEAELFGVERGAFTGAEPRPGLIELAHGGTLFLDEIGELPLPVQAKLLGFLDDGVVRRVGGTSWRTFSVRVVAATNRDLDTGAREGSFRMDLLHRLDVARVSLAPLRDRAEDLGPLADRILARLSRRDGVAYGLAEGELDLLARHPWPGNVRELSNTIERSTLLGPSLALRPSAFVRAAPPLPAPPKGGADDDGDLSLERVEREHVLRVVARCNGNRTMAASLLGIGASTLRRKLSDWAID